MTEMGKVYPKNKPPAMTIKMAMNTGNKNKLKRSKKRRIITTP